MSTLLTLFVIIVGHFVGKCTKTSDSHFVAVYQNTQITVVADAF